ncbi:Uu.00g085590.m01.CDS01 [Anthostomella pinea]|uniref:Uu.00g085590.m01.CDS01 n=1 Tax=Anthostomella pinea TaxID=933095 RepID=A0AAI8VGK7_9PEZI|nr:Uu.00g085590.m01.CDS01 [Anthostomella pinea]
MRLRDDEQLGIDHDAATKTTANTETTIGKTKTTAPTKKATPGKSPAKTETPTKRAKTASEAKKTKRKVGSKAGKAEGSKAIESSRRKNSSTRHALFLLRARLCHMLDSSKYERPLINDAERTDGARHYGNTTEEKRSSHGHFVTVLEDYLSLLQPNLQRVPTPLPLKEELFNLVATAHTQRMIQRLYTTRDDNAAEKWSYEQDCLLGLVDGGVHPIVMKKSKGSKSTRHRIGFACQPEVTSGSLGSTETSELTPNFMITREGMMAECKKLVCGEGGYTADGQLNKKELIEMFKGVARPKAYITFRNKFKEEAGADIDSAGANPIPHSPFGRGPETDRPLYGSAAGDQTGKPTFYSFKSSTASATLEKAIMDFLRETYTFRHGYEEALVALLNWAYFYEDASRPVSFRTTIKSFNFTNGQ